MARDLDLEPHYTEFTLPGSKAIVQVQSTLEAAALAEQAGDEDGTASRYRAALEVARALADSGRLAPRDAGMVGDLEQRLAVLGS